MTSEEIFKTMQDLIAEQFAVNADDVTMNSSFEDDLSADSVDLVELVMAMEEEFEIDEIPEEDLLGCIHYNPEVIDADRQGKSPYDFSPTAIEEIRKIKEILDRDEN